MRLVGSIGIDLNSAGLGRRFPLVCFLANDAHSHPTFPLLREKPPILHANLLFTFAPLQHPLLIVSLSPFFPAPRLLDEAEQPFACAVVCAIV